jgi:membrane-associated PAP2 superfamily phosphatase
MKLFSNKFIQTLIHNVATIAAIVVGIAQFLVRAYKENNGDQKVRQFVIRILHLVNTLTSKIYQVLDHDVPPVKAAQRRTKRS